MSLDLSYAIAAELSYSKFNNYILFSMSQIMSTSFNFEWYLSAEFSHELMSIMHWESKLRFPLIPQLSASLQKPLHWSKQFDLET